jgi:hypothetical protein
MCEIDLFWQVKMKLSKAQLEYFNTFGFLKFSGLFKKDISKITEEFETVWIASNGGHHNQQHDFQRRSSIIHFIDINVFLSSLIDDSRITGPVSSILGDDFNYSGSDGNLYVGDTRWHSDSSVTKKYRSLKIAFYLDEVAADSGCLRVLPGSIHYGNTYADKLNEVIPNTGKDDTKKIWGVLQHQVPSYPIPSTPGDMLMFDHRIKHSSAGGDSRRRMFTMNFERRYKSEDIENLKNDISGMAASWVEKPYGDIMIETASPQRMIHLEQRLQNGDHLKDLAKEFMTKMNEPTRGGAQFDE